jgi:uncharacterized membrane protein
MSTAVSARLESRSGSIGATREREVATLRRSNPSNESSRLSSLDAARGAAMLFVCMSHFASSYLLASGAIEAGGDLASIGMLASPTFVAVSGIVAGFIFVTRRRSFAHFRRKLVDRGVFLLLIGHPVLAVTGVLAGTGFSRGYRVGYITDAIAVAIIIGPWLVRTSTQRFRLLLAGGIFAVDWCAILLWSRSAGTSALAKHYLIGLLNPADVGVDFQAFPVIPWVAVYLVGTVIGERVASYYLHGARREGHLYLARIGFASFLIGAGGKLGLILLRHSAPPFAQAHPRLIALLSSYQKFPPGPIYICLYAGAGLLLVAGILEAGRRGNHIIAFSLLRQIGQASLFSYIAESYLYHGLFRSLRLPYTPLWPLLFFLSLAVIVAAAAVWNSIEGNRFLTVGIAPFLERNARRREIRHGRIRVDVAAI